METIDVDPRVPGNRDKFLSPSFFSTPIKSGSFETKSFKFFALDNVISSVLTLFSIMSALSLVVECDGFQHGNDKFSFKCIAVARGRARMTYYRVFDTNTLLTNRPDALWTYKSQMLHHGLALASAGLPQSMACPALIHAWRHFTTCTSGEMLPKPRLSSG